VTFNDGAKGVPVKELTLNIEPHQSGSGDPSPDNVRDISGYQSINVTRAGKNLLENQAISRTYNGVTFTINADKTITINGTATGGNASISIHPDAMSFDEPAILSGCPEGGSAPTYRLRARSATQASTYYNDYGSGVEIPAGEQFDSVLFSVYSGTTVDNVIVKPMIRSVSFADAEYEPYQGETYTITIPTAADAVYGGSLVINEDGSGALTVNRGFVNLTGGSNEEWAESGADYYCRFRSAIFDGKTPVQNTDDILCNRFIGSNTQGMHTGTAGLAVRKAKFPDSVTTLAECVTWVQSNNLECVYPLAAPQTYALTANQVTTLLGTNTVWMNTDGTINLTYRADLAKYIINIISSNQGD